MNDPLTAKEFMDEMGRLMQRCAVPVFGVVAFAAPEGPEAVTVAHAYGLPAKRIGICLALVSDKALGMVEQFAQQMPQTEADAIREGFAAAQGLAVDDSDAAEGTTILREARTPNDPDAPRGGRLR